MALLPATRQIDALLENAIPEGGVLFHVGPLTRECANRADRICSSGDHDVIDALRRERFRTVVIVDALSLLSPSSQKALLEASLAALDERGVLIVKTDTSDPEHKALLTRTLHRSLHGGRGGPPSSSSLGALLRQAVTPTEVRVERVPFDPLARVVAVATRRAVHA